MRMAGMSVLALGPDDLSLLVSEGDSLELLSEVSGEPEGAGESLEEVMVSESTVSGGRDSPSAVFDGCSVSVAF